MSCNARADSTRLAQSRQISGESVGKVHHGGGQLAFGEPSPYGKSWLRVEVLA